MTEAATSNNNEQLYPFLMRPACLSNCSSEQQVLMRLAGLQLAAASSEKSRRPMRAVASPSLGEQRASVNSEHRLAATSAAAVSPSARSERQGPAASSDTSKIRHMRTAQACTPVNSSSLNGHEAIRPYNW
ncbi:hypothetical protein Dimus_017977 [Dionaea muscipula]